MPPMSGHPISQETKRGLKRRREAGVVLEDAPPLVDGCRSGREERETAVKVSSVPRLIRAPELSESSLRGVGHFCSAISSSCPRRCPSCALPL